MVQWEQQDWLAHLGRQVVQDQLDRLVSRVWLELPDPLELLVQLAQLVVRVNQVHRVLLGQLVLKVHMVTMVLPDLQEHLVWLDRLVLRETQVTRDLKGHKVQLEFLVRLVWWEIQELLVAQVSKVSKDHRVLPDVLDCKGQVVRQATWVILVFKVQRETPAYLAHLVREAQLASRASQAAQDLRERPVTLVW